MGGIVRKEKGEEVFETGRGERGQRQRKGKLPAGQGQAASVSASEQAGK